MQQIHIHKIKQLAGRHYQWVLIVSMLPLFATKALFNLPLLIMAVLGSRLLLRRFRDVMNIPGIRLMLMLFLCLWLPILLSLPGAVEPGRAASTMVRYIGFPLAGIFIIWAMGDTLTRRRVLQAGLAIVLFWCLDGLAQFLFGKNILGNPATIEGRLTGLFYPKVRLGTVVAVMSPLVFEFVRLYWRRYWWSLFALPLVVTVVMLGGSRSSWIMLAVSLLLYSGFLFLVARKLPGWRTMLGVIVLIVVAVTATIQVPAVKKRINSAAGVFSLDFHSVDKATSRRLSLWVVAFDIYKDNPVNGIGPRGYRYAFEKYASPSNYWMKQVEKGGTHPHMMLLEVAAETGSIGLAGYLLYYLLLLRGFVGYGREARSAALPWVVAAMVAVFPLNVHMALYGSYWGTIAFWLLFVALGMMQKPRDESIRA